MYFSIILKGHSKIDGEENERDRLVKWLRAPSPGAVSFFIARTGLKPFLIFDNNGPIITRISDETGDEANLSGELDGIINSDGRNDATQLIDSEEWKTKAIQMMTIRLFDALDTVGK